MPIKSRYILYGGRFTRALMVEMVMAEGDIDYELREINIIKNQYQKNYGADFV